MTNARTNTISLGAAVLVIGLAMAACGSTRFVVVENGAAVAPADAAATEDSGATPSPPTPEEEADITEAIDIALSIDDRPLSERLPALDGAEDLESTMTAVMDLIAGLGVELVVGEIMVSGNDATATVSVELEGEPFASDLPVTLVRKESVWKVTRAGACTLLALASPCPDA